METPKPIVDVNAGTMGDNTGFCLPKWFVETWGIKKKTKYRIQIIEEVETENKIKNAHSEILSLYDICLRDSLTIL